VFKVLRLVPSQITCMFGVSTCYIRKPDVWRLLTDILVQCIPVVLNVGGIAPLGAMLRGKGAKKTNGAIGGEATQMGQKCSTTNRS